MAFTYDIPDKAEPRRGWTPAELNSILQIHIVRNRDGCALITFGCVEWESELYRGVVRARCYPRISLANDAASGLLHDSPALPVQPG